MPRGYPVRMDPVATTLVILALAVVAFLSNRIPLGIVAIGVSVALWATGVLDLGQALAGFGDPTVIFIATLFVVLSRVVTTKQAYRSVSWTTVMALSVAGAASFLTPVATPANTMVLEPGGYRFGDYWKLGLPLLLLFLVVAVLYVPLVWPF